MKNNVLNKFFELIYDCDSISDPNNNCKEIIELIDDLKFFLTDDLRLEFQNILNSIFNRSYEEQLFSFKQGFKIGFYLAKELE